MGMRGPPPTPTTILQLRGSWRAATRRGEPKPEPGAPPAPKSLTPHQKTIWRRLVADLESMGVISRVDGWSLERYCVYLERWRSCESRIAAAAGASTDEVEAILRESHRLHKSLREIEDRFGLTPSGRARLHTVGDGREQADPFEALMQRGGRATRKV